LLPVGFLGEINRLLEASLRNINILKCPEWSMCERLKDTGVIFSTSLSAPPARRRPGKENVSVNK